MKLDAIAKEKEELETKDAVQISTTKAKNLTDSQEFKSQKFLSEYQQELKTKMFKAVAEVNKWKRVIISYHDAQEQAKLEYMTKSVAEIENRPTARKIFNSSRIRFFRLIFTLKKC